MYKKNTTFFFSLSISLLISTSAVRIEASFTEPLYSCTVQFPSHFTKKPSIPARYKGFSLLIKDGSCTLPEDTGDIFYLLITPNVKPDRQKNGGARLKRIPEEPCKWYSITRNSTAAFNKHQKPWLICQETPDQYSEMLPDNTLVIFLDPHYVKGLKLVKDLCSSIKHIPALIIDTDVEETPFNESVEMCHLAAIDSKALHAPVIVHKKKKEGYCLSLVENSHRKVLNS